MKKQEFEYTYKAPSEEEKREIASIRRQYEATLPSEEKLSKLRRINAFVNNFANAVYLVFGVVGLLVFGLGMSMILEWEIIVFGIIVSLVGLIPITLAYPIYNIALKYNRKKYKNEILRLSDELLNEKE